MKKFLFFVVLLSAMITSTQAQVICIDTVTDGSTIYICGSSLQLFTAICPNSNLWDVVGYASYDDVDTITITNSAEVIFSCDGFLPIDIYIYLISGPPSEPWTFTTLSTCGSLHSQVSAQPGTTYLWNTGATTETIATTVPSTFPVTYMVTVTNACGIATDQLQITWTGPLPNLGPDATVCNQTTLNPGTFSAYQWTGGSTQPTLNVTTSGSYSVTVTNSSMCRTTDAVNITVDSAVSMEMCYVSFDTATWKNKIEWYVNPGQQNINNVQVEVWQGTWVPLGLPAYSSGSFIDWGSNPQGNQYSYQVRASNACGLGSASTLNVTIWLTELSNELQWQNYIGVTAPTEYTVFAIMDTGTSIAIDTVFACLTGGCLNHSPIVANPNVLKYFVAFQQSCTSNKSNGWVLSNYWDPLTGLAELPKEKPLLFPNPTTGIINIAGTDGENQVEVFDLSGRCILRTENASTINLEQFSQGNYFVKIASDSGVYTSKVMKQ